MEHWVIMDFTLPESVREREVGRSMVKRAASWIICASTDCNFRLVSVNEVTSGIV